jgi:hypothetical protein
MRNETETLMCCFTVIQSSHASVGRRDACFAAAFFAAADRATGRLKVNSSRSSANDATDDALADGNDDDWFAIVCDTIDDDEGDDDEEEDDDAVDGCFSSVMTPSLLFDDAVVAAPLLLLLSFIVGTRDRRVASLLPRPRPLLLRCPPNAASTNRDATALDFGARRSTGISIGRPYIHTYMGRRWNGYG